MLTRRELRNAFQAFGLQERPVIVHTSIKAFGGIEHGATALLGALLESVAALVVPTFTYKTMITPSVGPPNNALTYGSSRDANRMAEIFHPNMPADPLMGHFPETVRLHPKAQRSLHPILSFAGIQAERYLAAQTLFDPLAPIGALGNNGGWVLLLGVDHSVNTSIHYAEKLAGRRQFVRWALTPQRIVECPGFPGCSLGFQAIAPAVQGITRQAEIGKALVQAIPLIPLFEVVQTMIKENPHALLCDRQDCERCQAIKNEG
jgi:aminoglycoside 3-N-acetyltransferase